MFDKMKELMQMQRTMQEVKRQLDATTFSVASADGAVTVTMNGSQEVKEVLLREDSLQCAKATLERSIKDAYNRAVKRSQELAAQKMKEAAGLQLPGF
jgi:DNA-binding YbaB/EbfC family protein